jgi:hypothetical protein
LHSHSQRAANLADQPKHAQNATCRERPQKMRFHLRSRDQEPGNARHPSNRV